VESLRKRLLKLISIGLTLSTITIAVTACKQKGETSNANSSKTETKQVTKPDKIKFMTNVGVNNETGLDKWCEKYKELTGITVEVNEPANNEYFEKLDLAFASGDAPDIVSIASSDMPKYVSKGAFYDMTNLVKNSENVKNIDKQLLESTTFNGKTYATPTEYGGGNIVYYRQDWLDKTGKKLPTTYDEFVGVLKAFKGVQDDVIPYTAPGLSDDNFMTTFYQESVPNFTKVNGKWVDGMAQDNMKSALQRMRSAYEQGLIDTEVVTNKTTACREKWGAGRVGVFQYWAGNWNLNLDNLLKMGPKASEAKMVAAPPIKGEKYREVACRALAMSKDVKNPEGIFKYFIDFVSDGKQGSILFTHGVEGVHWQRKDSDTVIHLPNMKTPNTENEKAFYLPALFVNKITEKGYNFKLDERITNSLDILDKNGQLKDNIPTSKSLSKVNADLVALRDQTLANAVLGKLSVDDALAKYKDEAKRLGVDTIISELNETK
jgi:putative aldouronate transport system substrate-binding protein